MKLHEEIRKYDKIDQVCFFDIDFLTHKKNFDGILNKICFVQQNDI